jgi:hypothetical protein
VTFDLVVATIDRVDEHRRVEERRAEERMPAERASPLRQHVGATPMAVFVEIGDRRAHDRGSGVGTHQVGLTLEPFRQCNVVGVQPRDVLPVRLVEPAVEGSGEAALLVVAEDDEARVVDSGEDVRGVVGRGVVDHEQLEVAERLPQHTVDRLTQEACIVMDGEQDGDERHGR